MFARRRFHAPRRTWCCRRCGTARPSSATGSPTCAPRGTPRRCEHAASRSRSSTDVVRRAGPRRPDGRRRDLERLPARGFATVAGRLRRAGPRARRAPAADGGLLPRGPAAAGVLMEGGEPAGGRGTSTTTTASHPEGRRHSASPSRLARGGRDRRTRYAPTSTGGSADGRSRSSARTARGGSPRPGRRRWRRSTTSSSTGCPIRAHEDAVLEGDPWMAHSLLSAPMNLGLLDPIEVVGPPRRRTARGTRRSAGSRASCAR